MARTPDEMTRLAAERTRLAYERTMMAWVRTAVSLISFGFTIYQFFFFLQNGRPAAHAAVLSPRTFGITMIAMGLAALALAAVEYRRKLQRIRAEYGPQPRSLAAVVAVLVVLLGLMALATVIAQG